MMEPTGEPGRIGAYLRNGRGDDISEVLMTISSKTGTEPPASPVLPPCGTTANLLSLQYSSVLLTSCAFWGFKTSRVCPPYFRIQSVLKGVRSSVASAVTPSIMADSAPSSCLKNCTCSSVTSAKLGFRLIWVSFLGTSALNAEGTLNDREELMGIGGLDLLAIGAQ